MSNRNSETKARLLISTPTPIVTFSTGDKDARDIDFYPVIAYAATSQRFLLIWLSLRNALLESDGFTLYGQWLDPNGQPVGTQFRISDENTVARNSAPTLASDGNNFVVVWTRKGTTCQLYAQTIVDSNDQPDRPLAVGTAGHQHSPKLIFNSNTGQYILALVAGEDYLPMVVSNASLSTVASCGNNANSNSKTQVAAFHLENNAFQIDKQVSLSQIEKGAFRPTISQNATQSQLLVVWEDRRNAAGLPYRFDLYAQRLSTDLTMSEQNIALSNNVDYSNDDNSSTWTPRPNVTYGNEAFLVTWFEHTSENSIENWFVKGRFLLSGEIKEKFDLASMSFQQAHPQDAPTGLLTTLFDATQQEFVVMLTTHIESFTGYFSSLRLQRLTPSGQLLRLDGNERSSLSSGDRLDSTLASQLSLAASNDMSGTQSGLLTIYSKNITSIHARDYDLWGVKTIFQSNTPTPSPIFTPSRTPEVTTITPTPVPVTSTATPINIASPTPTATTILFIHQQNLPFVLR